MSKHRPALHALCAAVAACFAAAPAQALTVLWWDANGAAAGSGGSGLWDGSQLAWAAVAGGVGDGAPALPWPAAPAAADTVATFAGTAGTVTLKTSLQAAGLDFRSSGYTLTDGGGYTLTLGAAGAAGTLRVAAGSVATVQARLSSAAPQRAVTLDGGGTLVLDGVSNGPQSLAVLDATLRLGRANAAAETWLALGRPDALLDLGSGGNVDVGALAGAFGSRQQLGGRTLRFTGLGGDGSGSLDSALGLQGDAGSGLIVGTQRRLNLSWARAAQDSALGFFHLSDAAVVLDGHRMTLLAAGPGRESLRVEAGSQLVLRNGAELSAAGTPVVDGTLRLEGGGTRLVLPASDGLLHIGARGSAALLEVADGAAVAVGGRLRIGDAGSGAAGRVALGGVATLAVPLLGFGSAASVLEIDSGATLRIAEFDTAARGAGAAGRVQLGAGTLVVGDPSLDHPLLNPQRSSSFAGLLSGSGLLRKLGPGTLTLSNDGNGFGGRIRVEGGTLAATTGALRLATLTLEPGAALQMTPDAQGLFGIGALDGRFDLSVPAGRTLALGTPNGSAVWAGRFVEGNVAVMKVDRGTQVLYGSGPGTVFGAPRLAATGGTLALDGGSFAARGDPSQSYSVVAQGLDTRLQLRNGALLEARAWGLVAGGAALQLAGAGTLLRGLGGEGLPLQLGSVAGAGTLLLDQDARAELSHLLLDSGNAGTPSSARVVDGAQLALAAALQFEGPRGTLTVDGGSVVAPMLFVRTAAGFDGRIELSDPADGTPALTVWLGSGEPAGGSVSAFNGRIVDAAGGPGSLRKVTGSSFALLRPLEITGRLIVDGGTVALSGADDLRTVTLVANVAAPLDVSALPASATLGVGALAGAGALSFGQLLHVEIGSAGRDTRYDGMLALGSGSLGKVGGGTQVLAGGGSFASLSAAGGSLVLEGGAGLPYAAAGGLGVRHTAAGPATPQPRLLLRDGAVLTVAGQAEMTAPGAGVRQLAAVAQGGATELALARRLTLENTTLRIEDGARASTGGSIALSNGEIVVDRGSLVTAQLVGDAASRVWLADAAGGTALTLRREGTPDEPALALLDAFVADAPGGSGGIRFTGHHVTYFAAGTLAGTGPLVASGAEVRVGLQTAPAARSLLATDGAALIYAAPLRYEAGSARIETRNGGSVLYAAPGATLRGGVLVGTGHWAGADGFTFDGTTLAANSQLLSGADTTLRDATVRGEIQHRALLLTLDNTVVSTSGALRLVWGGALLRNSELNGVMDVGAGATVTLDGATAAGAGSRTTLAGGAVLAGSPLLLNGGLLINDGRVTAPVVVNHLGKAKGAGSFGSVTVNDGGTFAPGHSPGLASTGDAVFGAGGVYEVEVADARAGAGIGHDFWRVLGAARFEAGTTANSAFTLQLVSLGADGGAGTPLNWDAALPWRWTVLQADAVQGWTAGELRLDSSRFAPAAGGRFGLQWSADGLALDIVYAPVPEPPTALLALAGTLALLGWRRRRAAR